MRQLFFFVISILGVWSLEAQSRVEKSIFSNNIKLVKISLNKAYKIELITHTKESIEIAGVSDGERKDDLLVSLDHTKDTVYINDRLQPFTENHNDKLSAHKVFALQVVISVPKNLNVEISSELASLYVNGHFQNLFIELNSGNCKLKNFEGNALINTFQGDIEMYTKNSHIDANSKNGSVKVEDASAGNQKIVLRSIYGDITAHKIK